MEQIETPRLSLFLPQEDLAAECLAFEIENREHFAPWDPVPPLDYFTEEFWRRRLRSSLQDWESGRALRMFFRQREQGRLLGYCSLHRIERGARYSGSLSYGIARHAEGQGLMTEALGGLISYAFTSLALHRLEAVYLTENHRSARLLQRLGFSVEGLMRQYAQVGGEWRDHYLAALVNPTWRP